MSDDLVIALKGLVVKYKTIFESPSITISDPNIAETIRETNVFSNIVLEKMNKSSIDKIVENAAIKQRENQQRAAAAAAAAASKAHLAAKAESSIPSVPAAAPISAPIPVSQISNSPPIVKLEEIQKQQKNEVEMNEQQDIMVAFAVKAAEAIVKNGGGGGGGGGGGVAHDNNNDDYYEESEEKDVVGKNFLKFLHNHEKAGEIVFKNDGKKFKALEGKYISRKFWPNDLNGKPYENLKDVAKDFKLEWRYNFAQGEAFKPEIFILLSSEKK
jgi:hypothetical protein